MTSVKLDHVGLPGATYKFAGPIKKVVCSDGQTISLNVDPWRAKSDQLMEVSRHCNVSISTVEDAFIELQDVMQEKPVTTTRAGKNPTKVASSWDDVVKLDAKGNRSALNAAAIASLIYEDYVRIGDSILQVENHIGRILTKEELKIKVISGLKTIGAEDLWAMNTYQLVRDQLLPLIPEGRLGESMGYLPCKNGVLNLNTMQLDDDVGIYLKTLEVDFDPSATECPKITTMLNNMFTPDQKELVLSILGAALSGRRSPFILALSGSGRNGKSLLRELLEGLMMQMITTEKLENLHRDFVNDIFLGKKISWQTEVDSSRKLVNYIKDITGGTTIQVRKKYVDGALQYPLQMVCIIDTNNPPHFDESAAISERMRFVNMPHTFVYKLTGEPNEVLIDPNLVDNWQNELPAFLNMLLKYAHHFMDTGSLMFDIEGTVGQLRERSNMLSTFIDEYCDTEDIGGCVAMVTFQKYFSRYAKTKNVAVPEIEQVRYKLRKEFGFAIHGNTIRGMTVRKQARLIADDST